MTNTAELIKELTDFSDGYLESYYGDSPFKKVDYVFDLKGKTAGIANAGKNKIRYNLDIARENREHFLLSTVPHEVAHIIQRRLYPCSKPHGIEWRAVMRKLGISNPSRCHSYAVTPAKIHKKFEYKCLCHEPHLVGKKIHSNIQSGARYTCRKCKTVLTSI